MINLEFWGVRGSIASPGLATARYGGNTPCVSVTIDSVPGKILVLDAGTGIRALGKALIGKPMDIFLLLSHPHADHTQGLPFFAPLYESGRRIVMFNQPGNPGPSPVLEQMDGIDFPVNALKLPARVELPTDDPLARLAQEGFAVEAIQANHPGGCTGYAISAAGRRVIYLTDNELGVGDSSRFVEFCQDADVLIHDAQYVADEVAAKRGWGHSSVDEACELAIAANVRRLILFHHDPDRSDEQLDSIVAGSRQRLGKIQVDAAAEGMRLSV